jgi:hypothetical protein
LDFPAHEACRKERRKERRKKLGEELKKEPGKKELEKRLLYDPSSTLSLVRKWGPSTRNIIRSMKFAALELHDPIEQDAERAVTHICNNRSGIFEESLGISMPQSEDSSVIFLRRTSSDGNVKSGRGKTFIPTPHLLAMFEKRRRKMSNEESLELYWVHTP